MSKKLNEIIEKTLANIEEDRLVTRDLLEDAMEYLAKDEHRHREIGLTLAKYVETLQRSNEQMVKLSALLQKQQGGVTGLSEEDKSDLYDMLDKETE